MNNIGARRGENGDAFGKYELVSRIHNSVLDPGGVVVIEIFITGYGRIDASKIAFYPPIAVVEADSKLIGGFKFDKSKSMASWGGSSLPISPDGVVLQLDGMFSKRWPGYTSFFDAVDEGKDGYSVPQIMTEKALGENTNPQLPSQWNAPFRLELKIRKNAVPGIYPTSVSFTYFNGQTWEISSLQPTFTVRTVFQRYEKAISVIGIVAATGSASGLVFLAKQLYEWFFC